MVKHVMELSEMVCHSRKLQDLSGNFWLVLRQQHQPFNGLILVLAGSLGIYLLMYGAVLLVSQQPGPVTVILPSLTV